MHGFTVVRASGESPRPKVLEWADPAVDLPRLPSFGKCRFMLGVLASAVRRLHRRRERLHFSAGLPEDGIRVHPPPSMGAL